MKDSNENPDNKTKVTAIAIEIVLAIVIVLFYLLYSRGNQYVVGNTIDGLPILYVSMAIGLLIGFVFVYIIGKTSLNKIRFAKLQKVLGLWSLFAPIFLFGYIGFSLNLKLSEEKSEEITTVIEHKSGDLIMQSYYLEMPIENKNKKIRVSKTEWNAKSIGDTIKLSIINGFFGYKVVRYKAETNK